VGGWLADRVGGAVTTFWNFLGMAACAVVVLLASEGGSLPLFFVGFVALFVLSGVGNGSTYKMIPAIFGSKAQLRVADGADSTAATHEARRLANALIGIAGAIGAAGGVLVNVAFRQSFLSTGTGNGAYVAFIGYYLLCAVLTWAVYLRASHRKLAGV
jgi:NNP family nitrate/nitrite transporter-like MFS transporter